jgi:hypothetical protein
MLQNIKAYVTTFGCKKKLNVLTDFNDQYIWAAYMMLKLNEKGSCKYLGCKVTSF